MRIAVGDTIPEATVYVMGESGPESRISTDLFAGRKVVLFALPGAFTPTCSAKHLPCLLYTSPSPRDRQKSRMPSSA